MWRQKIKLVMQYVDEYSHIGAGLGYVALFGTSFVPNTIGIWYYKRLLAVYDRESGEEEPLDKSIKECAHKWLESIKLTTREENSFDFFQSNTMDPVFLGTSKIRTGVFVGLPYYMKYKQVGDIDKDRLGIGYREIDWENEQAGELLASMILSKNAIDFAILRQIHYSNSPWVILEGFTRSIFALLAYCTGYYLKHSLNLKYVLKRWARGVVYGFIGVVFLTMYIVIADAIACRHDYKMDRLVSNRFSIDITRGGVEFYQKQLQRNIALRSVMGAEGPPLYTKFGNERRTWRRPHVEIVSRKNELEKILKKREAAAAKSEDVAEKDSVGINPLL